MLASLRSSSRVTTGTARANSTIAGTLNYRCTYHNADKLALLSPQENVKWSYGEFNGHVQRVAGGLKKMGFQPGAVIATDMKNTVPNLLLQMAVAHNGMRVMTVKNAEELGSLSAQVPVEGAVFAGGNSFLSKASFPIAGLEAEAFANIAGKVTEGAPDRNAILAYYSSKKPIGNREVYLYGIGTAGTLEILPDDQVCIAASLNHQYGIGGVVSALVRNASIHLLDLSKPELLDSTLLITDKHQLGPLREAAKSGSKIRGGVVKVSSGYDLLLEKEKIGNAELWTLGGGDQVFRPLFDSCVDTYYSFK